MEKVGHSEKANGPKLENSFFNKINIKWNDEWIPYIINKLIITSSMNKESIKMILNTLVYELNTNEFSNLLNLFESKFIVLHPAFNYYTLTTKINNKHNIYKQNKYLHS